VREKLMEHVRELFRYAPGTEHNRELEAEVLEKSLERYDDLVSSGTSEESAYSQAVMSIGAIGTRIQHDSQLQTPVEKPKKKRTGWVLVGVVCVIAVLLGMGASGLRFLNKGFGGSRGMNFVDQIENWAEGLEVETEQWFDGGWLGSGIGYSDSEQYQVGAAEMTASAERVDIHWISGAVKLELWDGDALVLEETGNRSPEEALRWRLKNGVLTVQYCATGRFTDLPSKNLVIKVPAEMAKTMRVTVDAVSADCVGSGLEFDALELDGTSGELRIDGAFREVSADTVSGEVSISGVVQDLEVDTTSGDVCINLQETPDQLSVDTVSGDLELILPGERSFDMETETVSGQIRCELETRGTSEERFYDSGKGDRAAELDLNTVSGDLTIRKQA